MFPVSISLMLLSCVIMIVEWFVGGSIRLVEVLCLLLGVVLFSRDLTREYSFFGLGSNLSTLKFGVILFIFSEVMLFFSLFWSSFNFMFSVEGELGMVWPSYGIISIDNYGLPVLNSILLISSSVCLTIFHEEVMVCKVSFFYYILTLMLGLWFLLVQCCEYFLSGFSIIDSVCGSGFFILTGFHGLHVCLGLCFLLVVAVLFLFYKLNLFQVFLDFSVWYWHFVDVVWLYLFLVIYWWGI